jgi:hypothetical protein
VSVACTLNVICPEPVWLRCFAAIQLPIHAGPAPRHYDPSFSETWPGPSGSEQPSDIILMAMTWAGAAVEQPTITGRTRLGPHSVQPIICL